MGSKIPVITKAIKTKTIKFENNKFIVPEENIELNKEDILISYIARSEKPVLSDEKATLV